MTLEVLPLAVCCFVHDAAIATNSHRLCIQANNSEEALMLSNRAVELLQLLFTDLLINKHLKCSSIPFVLEFGVMCALE